MTLLWFGVGISAGVLLGLAFFGGLWWTTRRLVVAPQPGLLIAGSLLVRLVILGLGLTIVAQAGGAALIGALLGLIGVRIVMVRSVSQGRLESMSASFDYSRKES